MLRLVVHCPESSVLAILTHVKVDERFYTQISETTLSVRCPFAKPSIRTRGGTVRHAGSMSMFLREPARAYRRNGQRC